MLQAMLLMGSRAAPIDRLLSAWWQQGLGVARWALLKVDPPALGLATAGGGEALQGIDPQRLERLGGCPCCVGALAWRVALSRLIRRAPPQGVVIALSGGGHPGPTLDLIRSPDLASALVLRTTIALIDAQRLDEGAGGPALAFLLERVNAADGVVLRHAGVPDARRRAELHQSLAALSLCTRPVIDWTDGPGLAVPSLSSVLLAVRAPHPHVWWPDPGLNVTHWWWRAEPQTCFDRRALAQCLHAIGSDPRVSAVRAYARTPRAWYEWSAQAWVPSAWRADSRIGLSLAADDTGRGDRLAWLDSLSRSVLACQTVA